MKFFIQNEPNLCSNVEVDSPYDLLSKINSSVISPDVLKGMTESDVINGGLVPPETVRGVDINDLYKFQEDFKSLSTKEKEEISKMFQ